jgi:hypothetical protein
VIGALAWLIIGSSVAGLVAFPHVFLPCARLFGFYLLIRLTVTVVSYLIGLLLCHRAESRMASAAACHGGVETATVHHIVVIPNFEEPIEVLARALAALAAQHDAGRCISVVLAMEARENDAQAKARSLENRFADRFAHFLTTFHPADRPGEVAGKGSNQAWAARQAEKELLPRLTVPLEQVTLTSCDADSVFHPRYFARLAQLFASDQERHRRFWYAPVLYHNNLWRIPGLTRVFAIFSGAIRLGELVSPLSRAMPISTYTLSFKLARDAGYWDPMVISEDWHMYLRCLFAAGGHVSLKPIFLPTSSDAVEGDTLRQTLVNTYRQQLRHAWGAEDAGYVLQQWRRAPTPPGRKKVGLLLWILHSHLLRSTSWFVLMLGSLASRLVQGTFALTAPAGSGWAEPIWICNGVGLLASIAMWTVERSRCPARNGGSQITALLEEVAAWVLFPVLALVLTTLPGLHAQTKLMVGSPLAFRRTPKGNTMGERRETSPTRR